MQGLDTDKPESGTTKDWEKLIRSNSLLTGRVAKG